jgi:hypothetical protein
MGTNDMYFNDRVVAFLDVLGFTNLIAQAEASPAGHARFMSLLSVIESRVSLGNNDLLTMPADALPVYTFVSDSIIISAPVVYDGGANCSQGKGINVVTIKVIQIAQKLLEMGFLVRGGIAVGKAWHTTANVFGSAYIAAYQTEQRAKHPCILLDKSAVESLLSDPGPSGGLIAGGAWLEGSGDVLVDTLNPIFGLCFDANSYFADAFQCYRKHIIENLSQMERGTSEWKKWEWFAEFFNANLHRHSLIKCEPIPIERWKSFSVSKVSSLEAHVSINED